MQKYMTHPKHGGKLVFMDDFENMEKDGWVFGEEIKVEEAGKMVPIGMAAHLVKATGFEVVESLGDRYEKKFGKRPHWKMKDETIEDALKE